MFYLPFYLLIPLPIPLFCEFLKDGSDILARSISQLCNLSIKINSFPRSCKTAF